MWSVFVATAQAQWDTDSTGKISFDNFVQGKGGPLCLNGKTKSLKGRVQKFKANNLLSFALQGVNQMRHRIRALQDQAG